MEENLEKNAPEEKKVEKIPTFAPMTRREWLFIQKRCAISYKAIGRAPFLNGNREKPFTRSTIYYWTLGSFDELMPIKCVETLYLAMRPKQFEQLRQEFFENQDEL